jgi:hypothetical protein
MEKKLIKKRVFEKYFGKEQPKWKDIKDAFELQDEHLVRLTYDEDDEDWLFEVETEELESDEEYNARLVRLDSHNKWQKQQRYKQFLELQKEFENKDHEGTFDFFKKY